jgi:serine/threonine-protein kinase
MITGGRLFVNADGGAIRIEKLLRGTIEPPGVHAPGTPRLLDAIVLHGLARNPEQRFGTAREMALALEKIGPLATATEIGEWVESLAAPVLAERASCLERLEMESSTFRTAPARAPATRVLPDLFDDDEAQDEPLLELPFPIDGPDPTPAPSGPLAPFARFPQGIALETPQAIAVPLVTRKRPPPRAVVVFAAYALLGGAIVLLAAALRWTHADVAGTAVAPPPCTPAMTRIGGGDAAAPLPYASATSSRCVSSAPEPTRIGGPQ